MSKAAILAKIRRLKELYDAGQIPQLHQHEVNPGLEKGSRENYLYFTLPVCLNFQRSSPAMWQAALATWNDPETNYLYFPEEVVTTEIEKVRSDLLKHKLALQPNKHVEIWTRISKALHEHFDDDPREIIKAGQNCVVRIKDILQIKQKEHFPYLRGPKMANYWLYILHHFTDVKLRNLHKLSIIPDTHVQQASIILGLTGVHDGPEAIAEAWFKLLKGTELIPIDLHPILWNWSRNHFEPGV